MTPHRTSQRRLPMTNVAALRSSVMCGIAAVSIAGCGAVQPSSPTRSAAPAAASSAGGSATAPTATATATTAATPGVSGINQLISGIDNQLGTIDGQLNAANAGLSTGEGDPSQ